MKKFKHLTAIITFSCIMLASCEEDIENKRIHSSAEPSTQLSAETKEMLNNSRTLLQAELKEKLKILATHPEYRNLVLRALNAVEETPCDANTPLRQWLDQELADWTIDVIGFARNYALFDLPTYDALIFENSSENQYFGVNGEYTKQITKTFKDLHRFWDIQSDDIVLAAMHGNMLLDREKIARTYVAVFVDENGNDISPELAAQLADIVVTVVEAVPQYRDGNHPIFTFSAYALQGFDFIYGPIPDKIVMGDGVLEAYTDLGYGDVAPQAILTHEFAHHIQFQLDLFADVRSPEATRRNELMADAYAAYYLSHARGATMQWKRVQQFLQVFFNVGDCSFDNDGHHGTPTQRLAAAEWGYQLADDAQKQGHILSAEEFAALFDAQLPGLVVL